MESEITTSSYFLADIYKSNYLIYKLTSSQQLNYIDLDKKYPMSNSKSSYSLLPVIYSALSATLFFNAPSSFASINEEIAQIESRVSRIAAGLNLEKASPEKKTFETQCKVLLWEANPQWTLSGKKSQCFRRI